MIQLYFREGIVYNRAKDKLGSEVMKLENDIQKSLDIYKEQLSYGYIRTAYLALIKYFD